MVQVAQGGDLVNFSHDILPILSDRCFHCHGPDASNREADLRLDQRASPLEDRGDYAVLTPGKPELSELLKRLNSDDPDLQMPPPDSHRRPLSRKEISTFRQWIDQGAVWGNHWAFEKPVRAELPLPMLHPIDSFVQRRLEKEDLAPSNVAAKHTLIRRVTFDLTGLPPTWQEVEAFRNDESPDAYARLVDRLLQSEHYGERMATWWLDAARYSDTDGYQADATRNNWPWRDWVVQAFHKNMPFDQFTREQFAGDLLPDATPEQRLATCFHRNHMANGEGGRHPEESRIDYVIDRVNTTGTVWLGLTLGCCQCHSHKFDPISQREYYSLFAFFDSIDEDGKAGSAARPFMKFKSPYAERAVQEAQAVVDRRKPIEAAARERATKEFAPWLADRIRGVKDGFQSWEVLQPGSLESAEGTVLVRQDDGAIQASGPTPGQDDYRVVASSRLSQVTGVRLEVFSHETHTDGKLSRGATGEFVLTNVKLLVRQKGQSQERDVAIAGAVADVQKEAKGRNYGNVKDTLDDDPRNGWTTAGHDATKTHTAVFALTRPLQLTGDEELIFVMLHRSTEGNANIGRFRVSLTDQPGSAVQSLGSMPLAELAAAKPNTVTEVDSKLRKRLLDQFLFPHSEYQRARGELDLASRQLAKVRKAAGDLNVMVLAESRDPRTTHVLQRGVWDKKGEQVGRSFPLAIDAFTKKNSGLQTQPLSRIDLANWLVSRENPLTARVVVNHLWQMCFGHGLVRTADNFGLQGELPTHPDLLDWLAVELMEHDWNLQHIQRLIVTSETYRQDSRCSKEMLEHDPDNRLLARGSRFRLPSWMIRDAALRSSGLINPAIGGPPVMPYQPDGVWAEIFMERFRYEPSQGATQHRRTLYAFWRRSAAPTFLFDSSQRRVCEVQPRLTNTPLHALTLLNDQSQLEAARELARRAQANGGSSQLKLTRMFQDVLSRTPSTLEVKVLQSKWKSALAHYQDTTADAHQLLDLGQPEKRGGDRPQELAAYMVVASMIYNLDEAMTHE
ncbi:MAG: DUF1549 domain-containing protein [Fuerstiella sp.]|nr:DUF1549 domain-containing protein [Fuerstiella sp.]MCP4855366.1 DUF1549 domain-containing protein [Fuerstiella sp.]